MTRIPIRPPFPGAPVLPDRPQSVITNELASVYKAHYGRGPTHVTVTITDAAVVCILEDVNSPTQDSLVRYGAVDLAQATHQQLQNGMAPQMIEIVEAATGRAVRAYVPGFNAAAAAATDTFLLGDGPPADERAAPAST